MTEISLAKLFVVALTYLFACPLSEVHMGSRHCAAAAALDGFCRPD